MAALMHVSVSWRIRRELRSGELQKYRNVI